MRITTLITGLTLLFCTFCMAQEPAESKKFQEINGKKYTVVTKVETKVKPKMNKPIIKSENQIIEEKKKNLVPKSK